MSYLVKYTSFNDLLTDFQPVHQSLLHPPHMLFLWTWSSCRLSRSLKKLHNFGGEVTFPQEITQFWRGISLPSRNCAILSGSLLGSKIAQICLSLFTGKIAQFLRAWLLSLEIAQFWAAVSYSTKKLRNPSGQPTQLPPKNAHSLPKAEQTIACAVGLTGSLQD